MSGLGISFRVAIEDTEEATILTVFYEEVEVYEREFVVNSDHEAVMTAADAYMEGFENALVMVKDYKNKVETYAAKIEAYHQNQPSTKTFLTSDTSVFDSDHI